MGTDGQTCPSVPKLGTDGHPVTKVTSRHQKWPKMGQNSIISPYFAKKKNASAKGRSPPQELEVGVRSWPNLLVSIIRRRKKEEKKLFNLFSMHHMFD